MVRYIKVEVEIHGLNSPTFEKVLSRLRDAIYKEFDCDYKSQIEIELIESAGAEENG